MLIEVQDCKTIRTLLKQEPIMNLNIEGVLSYGYEGVHFYVDDVNAPSGVYVKVESLGHHYVYAVKSEFAHRVLETLGEEAYYCFSGVQREVAEVIKARCDEKGYEVDWENPCDTYYYPYKQISLERVNHEIISIPFSEAERINEFYTYRDEGTLEMIRQHLKDRPSAGVYENNELVSWVLVHEDDSMGIMYTVEEARRKGYGLEVSLVLINEVLKQGRTPYVQIVKSNGMSPGLARKCGMVKAGECSWFGLVKKSK